MKERNSILSFSFLALLFTALVINMGVSIIIPAMPIIITKNEFSQFFFTLSFVGLLLGRFIMSNITGYLLIKHSPLMLLLMAFGLHATTMTLFIFVHDEIYFVLLRACEGIFEGIVSVALQVMVIALSTPEDRGKKMGIFQSSFALGFMIGPAIGGTTLQLFGSQGVFHVTSLLMIVGFIWLLFSAQGIRKEMSTPSKTIPKFTLDFIAYLPLYSGAILQRGLYVALSILLPLYLVDRFQLSPYQVGFYFTGSAVITTFLMPIGGRVADTSYINLSLLTSICSMGISLLGCGLSEKIEYFTLFYALETLAFAFMAPAAMKKFGDAVQSHPLRGQIVGTSSSMRELINIIMVLFLVPIYHASNQLPWFLLGILTLLVSLPYIHKRRIELAI
ncbi:MAG: MFS transporter [Magnetococcus sp. DMHC-6]